MIFAIWQRKNLPSRKIFLFSTFAVLLIFSPQIIFDVVKGGVLSQAIKKFVFEEGSFKFSFWEILKLRLAFYWEMLSFKIWVGRAPEFVGFFVLSILSILLHIKELWKKDGFKILVLLGASPLIGMIFFQGNEGNVFDYYFTGYYLIYVLLFSVGLGFFAKNKFVIVMLAIFFILFFKVQIPAIKGYLINGRSNINLKEQLQAIDWIYKNADGQPFNVDVYVPPVIPYAYDYLFIWKGEEVSLKPSTETVGLLYTLYEVDTPRRLDPWLARQERIGRVLEEISFRGITVQRRERFK